MPSYKTDKAKIEFRDLLYWWQPEKMKYQSKKKKWKGAILFIYLITYLLWMYFYNRFHKTGLQVLKA